MPQASREQRKRWRGPSADYAEGYLEGRGYRLGDDFCWYLSVWEPAWEPGARDLDAISFLVNEWDYGDYVRGDA